MRIQKRKEQSYYFLNNSKKYIDFHVFHTHFLAQRSQSWKKLSLSERLREPMLRRPWWSQISNWFWGLVTWIYQPLTEYHDGKMLSVPGFLWYNVNSLNPVFWDIMWVLGYNVKEEWQVFPVFWDIMWTMGKTNRPTSGWNSTDRSVEAALLSTLPGPVTKSSANDFAPLHCTWLIVNRPGLAGSC